MIKTKHKPSGAEVTPPDMPYSADAEAAVLGSLMLNNDCWDEVSLRVRASDFWVAQYRFTFESMEKLVGQRMPIDLITLTDAIEHEGNLERAGGFANLAEMSKHTPSAANVMHYADIVAEKSRLRALLQVAGTIIADVSVPGAESTAVQETAESRLYHLAEQRSGDLDEFCLMTALERMVEGLESNVNAGGITGTPTGFTDLDLSSCGLQSGDLVLLAARPSMGKTTLALNMCNGALQGTDKPVYIFSIEMPAEQLLLRQTAALGRVELQALRSGQMSDECWARVSTAVQIQSEWQGRFVIDDTTLMTPTLLRARARRYVRQYGTPALIMVDYLQLMTCPGEENRTQEIAQISRSLKALGKELGCPILALSQLNRSVESRADKRPNNGDLRDSGALEQDADLIMMLYRDEVYNSNSPDAGTAEVIITKQRNGSTGTIKLRFDGRYTLFENLRYEVAVASAEGYRP